MMTRQDRAKQFMPFDAMKGLQEALRDREERHSRVERHEISEEQQYQNSLVMAKLVMRTRVTLDYYHNFHDARQDGIVTEINTAYRYLKLDGEIVHFEDIYGIRVTDIPSEKEY